MPGIHVTVKPRGNGFKVHDAGTSDSTACAETWDGLFSSFSARDDSTFEHTARLHETEHLPELEEEIELEE